MCGIVAAIGVENAPLLALNICLQHQSRGEDATGISYLTKDCHIKELKRAISPTEYLNTYSKELQKLKAINIAIAHNRAATCNLEEKHLDKECHPFMSEDKTFTLMQNGTVGFSGIMGTYLELTGHKFHSGIDSEVLMHMLEDIIRNSKTRDEAFDKFCVVYVGNIIVMFNDGEVWGLGGANDNLNIVVGNNCVFMASQLSSITNVVDKYPDNKAMCLTTTKGGAQVRIIQKNNKLSLVKHGEWIENILVDGEWVGGSISTVCDFCNKGNRRCQKFKVGTKDYDRCHECFKAGVTTLPEAPHYSYVNNPQQQHQSYGERVVVDPNVDTSQNLTVICAKCHLPHTNLDTIICKNCNKAMCNLCFASHNCEDKTTDPSDTTDIIDFLYSINERKIEELIAG